MKDQLTYLICGIVAIGIGIVFNVIYEYNTMYTVLAIIAVSCYVSGIGLAISSIIFMLVSFFKQIRERRQ